MIGNPNSFTRLLPDQLVEFFGAEKLEKLPVESGEEPWKKTLSYDNDDEEMHYSMSYGIDREYENNRAFLEFRQGECVNVKIIINIFNKSSIGHYSYNKKKIGIDEDESKGSGPLSPEFFEEYKDVLKIFDYVTQKQPEAIHVPAAPASFTPQNDLAKQKATEQVMSSNDSNGKNRSHKVLMR
jgi:hypothetical protein